MPENFHIIILEMMKTHCIPSKDLQDLAVLTWVSADTAVAASVKDNCLYEIVMPPNL